MAGETFQCPSLPDGLDVVSQKRAWQLKNFSVPSVPSPKQKILYGTLEILHVVFFGTINFHMAKRSGMRYTMDFAMQK